MEILYLLIPLSAVLVLAIIAVFGWALHHGQFDDVEREGARILDGDGAILDGGQVRSDSEPEELPARQTAVSQSGQSRTSVQEQA
jgi:cbb3-type cytochrome oxidase maturation protein